MMQAPLLAARSLTKSFDGFVANREISLDLNKGELVSIIGPNGAGKSTLFNMLSGCLSPDSGSLMFKGIDLIGVPTHRFVRCGIAKSFQITSVFPALSVLENVCAAVQAVDRPFDIWTRRSCLRQHVEKATGILANVGLLDKRHARADSISHGEQRSLEIAIALASDPELLLLDEPTAGMSPEETRSVISLVERIRSSRTIALVEHKMKLIMEISDRIIVLHQGEVLAVGTPATIQMDENVKRVYLGTGRGGRK